MSQLPSYYHTLRQQLATAVNALDAYEKACIAKRWGVTTDQHGRTMDAVEAKAIKTVENMLVAVCEYAGVRARQTMGLMEQIDGLQKDNAMLQKENTLLTEALHRAVAIPHPTQDR